jgi:transcription-repair coupling factor (superfamily II helicase)
MSNYVYPLKNLKGYEVAKECIEKGTTAQICGCTDSLLVNFMSGIGDGFKRKVIVTFDAKKATEIYEDLRGTGQNAAVYPAKDFIFFSADVHGNLMLKERLEILSKIINEEVITIVVPFDGLMDKVLPLDIIRQNIVRIEEGATVEIEALKKKLVMLGYDGVEQVQNPGEFAVRGSIVDVFTLTNDNPYRIDFWDEEVDIIKSFDVASQRAIENLESIEIYPATEYIITKEQVEKGIKKITKEKDKCIDVFMADMKTEQANRLRVITNEFVTVAEINGQGVQLDSYVNYFFDELVSFIDYFDDDTLFLIDEPRHISERCDAVETEFKESMVNRLSGGYVLPRQTDVMWPYKKILAKLKKRKKVVFTMLDQKVKEFDIDEKAGVDAGNLSPYNNQFELLVEDLKKYKKQKYAVLILSPSRTRGQRLAENLREYELNAVFSDDSDRDIKSKEIVVSVGSIHKGFIYRDIKYVVISETDIFGKKKKKKKKKQFSGMNISSFSELNVGDYVVHENHGLGIYRGIEKVEVDRVVKDYLKIEYAAKGFLYIAATQLNMIQKYAAADAKPPKLNKLGGNEWTKTKSRTKAAVNEIADELVALYAARQQKNGFVFSPETVWQKEFEELFPYDETDDQLRAINAVKDDMESTKIMDRLICGDVGFGKTEVAIRAAFKAVQDNKQVAYLVPTTVLAQQHYNTFTQRFKDFPVRVDMLSRFRTKAQVTKTLTDLKKGYVDIVIGTHRLLSKDVKYKDLGLLIIDEEQRFGVTHKEKIKQLKENVDVMVLTATPIPRTLHMSLIGIRDMSIIEEPPQERTPIQTYVMEYNDEIVREAINRELIRGGQVYYIYNNVKNIDEIAARISKLVPDANVAFAHGQMSERMIESIMYDFVNGDIDVLVSTTIVETGIDISNANTMIVHDADKLGLSQLYQLRGRVGRSNRTAYAFMMYKRNKILKEVAEKRLQAIRDFSELGAGFKIAMRDLEIRGAGNILGAKQHGHMAAVGYDLYCKMLNEAVEMKKGIRKEESFETTIDLDVDAFIPNSYISNEFQKLDVYKRIAAIENMEEYEDMQDELQDRYGDIPNQVENLLKVALMKGYANGCYITDISGGKSRLKLTMWKDAKIDTVKIPALIEKYRGRLKLQTDQTPCFVYSPISQPKGFEEVYDMVMDMIKEIESLKFEEPEQNEPEGK